LNQIEALQKPAVAPFLSFIRNPRMQSLQKPPTIPHLKPAKTWKHSKCLPGAHSSGTCASGYADATWNGFRKFNI